LWTWEEPVDTLGGVHFKEIYRMLIEELEMVVAPESAASWAGLAAGIAVGILVCSS
jgi:hypothetical protein